ncbi:hypothetical protein EHM76_03855 [bacterium]|nr:MAG: hypothetical protein EHM76_03855 [bacterium]
MSIITGAIVSITSSYVFQISPLYSVIFGVASCMTFFMTILVGTCMFDQAMTRKREKNTDSTWPQPGMGH